MGLLSILNGNKAKGTNGNASDSYIEDIKPIVHDHVFGKLFHELSSVVGEALAELGEEAPTLIIEAKNEVRKLTVCDIDSRYAYAADRIADIISEISADLNEKERARFRDYCLDLIEAYSMGVADFNYLRQQLTRYKSARENIQTEGNYKNFLESYLKELPQDESKDEEAKIRDNRQTGESIKRKQEKLDELKKQYENARDRMNEFIAFNSDLPSDLINVFEIIKGVYQKDGIDGAMDFAEAMCLPLHEENRVSAHAKQGYADTIISMLSSGLRPERINEIACSINQVAEKYIEIGRANGLDAQMDNNVLAFAMNFVPAFVLGLVGKIHQGDSKCS